MQGPCRRPSAVPPICSRRNLNRLRSNEVSNPGSYIGRMANEDRLSGDCSLIPTSYSAHAKNRPWCLPEKIGFPGWCVRVCRPYDSCMSLGNGGAHVTAKGGGALWSTHAINKNCVARLPPLSPQKATLSDTWRPSHLVAHAHPVTPIQFRWRTKTVVQGSGEALGALSSARARTVSLSAPPRAVQLQSNGQLQISASRK